MSGAGKKVYKGEWYVFSARYLRHNFGIYLLQGLAPSPRIENKLIPNLETESLVMILCTIHSEVMPNADTIISNRSLRAVIPWLKHQSKSIFLIGK